VDGRRPRFRLRDKAFRADLREDVHAGIAYGTIRPDAEPADVAVAVLGQLRGIGFQHLLDPQAVDLERLRRSVAEQWRIALTVRRLPHTEAPGASRLGYWTPRILRPQGLFLCDEPVERAPFSPPTPPDTRLAVKAPGPRITAPTVGESASAPAKPSRLLIIEVS